jgi:hypothetical protein
LGAFSLRVAGRGNTVHGVPIVQSPLLDRPASCALAAEGLRRGLMAALLALPLDTDER